jgi:hypothetical protein
MSYFFLIFQKLKNKTIYIFLACPYSIVQVENDCQILIFDHLTSTHKNVHRGLKTGDNLARLLCVYRCRYLFYVIFCILMAYLIFPFRV